MKVFVGIFRSLKPHVKSLFIENFLLHCVYDMNNCDKNNDTFFIDFSSLIFSSFQGRFDTIGKKGKSA
jgi:hypothetical protein